uniref:Uncharacterized protein n=1 Tax=Anguilla anguilla TaxID=7936 RepID=A0A0E9QPE4_ANGAN
MKYTTTEIKNIQYHKCCNFCFVCFCKYHICTFAKLIEDNRVILFPYHY